jgi:hypothetical protein
MELAMKIEYGISIEDFRALQVPFTGRARANAGFKGLVVACCLVAALGVYCLVQGLGLPVGAFLIGLAALGVVAAYFFDVRSVRRAKQNCEKKIATAYQQLHCRDRRTLEVSEFGFTLSCKCGVVTRPWSELTQFSESDKFFLLRTKAEGVILPKSAFTSEGDKTEFRRLATDQINKSRPFASRPIEFLCSGAERRSARLLHIVQGGGWRLVLRVAVILLGLSLMLNFFLHSQGGQDDPTIPLKAAGLVFGAFLVAMAVRVMRVKPRTRTPLRVHFGEEGLHLQDQVTIARYPWEGFCGYLENSRIFLIYHNPRLYRIIPKRALASREPEFRALLLRKLSPFDYRNPIRAAAAQISKPA